MATGNSVKLQLGKETTYGTKGTATSQVLISAEAFKETYNKIDEGLAVGGRGQGKIATMGIGTEGSFSTLFRPDMGSILKAALGDETVTATTEAKKHTFKLIGCGASDHLPSFTYYLDRVIGKFAYPGSKVNSLTLSAEAGNYLNCEVSTVGQKEESVQIMLTTLTPSTLRAFKFAQGKVYFDNTEVADVKSMDLEINNNLTTQEQTTSTGNYYKQPEVGVREITSNLSMIYSASAETLRNTFYKSDSTFSLKLEFTSDEVVTGGENETYKMTITCPVCQCSDSAANMGGLSDTIPQTMAIRVCDDGTNEPITIELINTDNSAY